MDATIVLTLHGLAMDHPWLAALAVAIADYGVFLLPVALIAIWLVSRASQPRLRRAVLAGWLAAAVAICLGLVLERTLGRSRPFVELGIAPLIPHAPDSSFPSDHTLFGVALVGAVAWRAPGIGLWLFGWALLVGVARIMAALHYPSDIVGSALLALVLAVGAWILVGVVPRPLRRRLAINDESEPQTRRQ